MLPGCGRPNESAILSCDPARRLRRESRHDMVKSEIRNQPDGSLHATLIGKVDEHFDGAEVLRAATASAATRVVLKLDGLRSISSLGVRALEGFLRDLGAREVLLDDISAALANQLSMIPNLLGSAKVVSARLPFVCPSCGAEALHTIPYQGGAAVTHAPPCAACGHKMDFDGFAEEYLPHSK